MKVTMMSGSFCACPTCSAFTMAMPDGQGDYCPSCLTVVTRVRGVKIVKPNAFRAEAIAR